MVVRQLQARDIVDGRVLTAMASVPRHRFVPGALQHRAYDDTPLPIGHWEDHFTALCRGPDVTIAGCRTRSTGPRNRYRLRLPGRGAGRYQAAVLAAMGVRVFSIEIVPELGRQAIDVLDALGYNDIRVKIGDGYLGWPEHAPFDGIIVTCAPGSVPDPLKAQLAENGRMVIPVGEAGHQQLLLLTKQNGGIRKEKIVNVRFVPMVDERGKIY